MNVWWCAVQRAQLIDEDLLFCQEQDIDYGCGPMRLVPVDALVLVRDAEGNWPNLVQNVVAAKLESGVKASVNSHLRLSSKYELAVETLDALAEAAKETT